MPRRIDNLLSPRLRAAALMPAAVLTVHQLRYLLAFGGGSGAELEKEGHQYLSALAAPIAMLVAIVIGLFFARLAAAWRVGAGEGRDGAAPEPASAPRHGFLRLALSIGAALLALYSCQELLEGMLSTGHPGGFEGVFGAGGWWAVPLAFACGAVVAAALRGAGAAIRWAAGRHRHRTASHGRPAPTPRPRRLVLPRPVPLAAAAAGRAPPRGLLAHQ
ncbi:MAG TPA: hypothetical protein VMF55_04810 [Solirubrobacterales bacterium]|nr:hypothetical protein [Solirubrobacterales bacterium]